ncbi:hypothetical protein J3F83DRAFT_632507 [Trichoderma novae-zelandiae]
MDPRTALRQVNQASHSRHLTSFTGGSDMLEVTPNDISFENFVAAADGTFKSQGPSRGRNSSHAPRTHFSPPSENPGHLFDSLQLAVASSFPSSAGSSPDWARQQPRAANDDVALFSSFHQGYNLGHSHQPQHEVDAQMSWYAPLQAQEQRLSHPTLLLFRPATGFRLLPSQPKRSFWTYLSRWHPHGCYLQP